MHFLINCIEDTEKEKVSKMGETFVSKVKEHILQSL